MVNYFEYDSIMYPNQRVSNWQVPNDLLGFGKMLQFCPSLQPFFLAVLLVGKEQKGLRYGPFLPIHHIFGIGPARFIGNEGIHEFNGFAEFAAIGQGEFPQIFRLIA